MYKVVSGSVVVRISDGANIPFSEDNKDYREFLEWVEGGNTPDIEQADVAVPTIVSARQARLALLSINKLSEVDQLISGLGKAATIEWEFAQYIERNNHLIPLLGFSEEDIDSLFALAASF